MPLRSSLSVLLNVSYNKIHEYIWFRGGDLNGFRDIKPLGSKWSGACPGTPLDDFPVSLIKCILSLETLIYMA